jgi:hypothetical protein
VKVRGRFVKQVRASLAHRVVAVSTFLISPFLTVAREAELLSEAISFPIRIDLYDIFFFKL